jgi:hypothetical protein
MASPFDNNEERPYPAGSLAAAVDERDIKRLTEFFRKGEFFMIELGEESDDDGRAMLTAEVDEFEALVAFTTLENTEHFTSEMTELFDESEDVSGLTVDGTGLLAHIPEGFGLLIDPETDTSCILTPKLLGQLVSALDEAASG